MDLGGLKVKDLPPILSSSALIDVCLSKTQRKTPTEIHKKTNINIIKKFYIRKVKACASSFLEKLKNIVQLFPKLDSIHPFYGDLLNILYDRDHYKIALSNISSCCNKIEKINKEYINLIKYADSLYKAKSLKTAAFGRYCSNVKKLNKVLGYLEEVRMHMQRLPVINTSSRNLILCGFPNVGKSSFINLISNANVDVQPFPFTTKSLFVGHFDHLYTKWQIIDTPGILDHSLEERNLIEMLAITALTHLQCAVLFIIDISEECGYSLDKQINLFNNIYILFKNKPIIIILNKKDKKNIHQLPQQFLLTLKQLETEKGVAIATTSTLTGDGIDEAKTKACELLLQQRMLRRAAAVAAADPAAAAAAAANADTPLAAAAAAAALAVKGPAASMLHVSSVQQPRKPNIPDSVLKEMELKRQNIKIIKDKTERELEEEGGGPGVYNYDMRKNYILEDESWRYDVIPEIINGLNINDFINININNNIKLLEQEEQQQIQQEYIQQQQTQEQLKKIAAIRQSIARLHKGIKQKRMEAKLKKKRNGPRLLKKTKQQLAEARRALREEDIAMQKGDTNKKRKREEGEGEKILTEEGEKRRRLRDKIISLRKERQKQQKGEKEEEESDEYSEIDEEEGNSSSSSSSRNKNKTTISRVKEGEIRKLGGLTREKVNKLIKINYKQLKGTKGESDRFIQVKKNRWMLSGKRGLGKTHSR